MFSVVYDDRVAVGVLDNIPENGTHSMPSPNHGPGNAKLDQIVDDGIER